MSDTIRFVARRVVMASLLGSTICLLGCAEDEPETLGSGGSMAAPTDPQTVGIEKSTGINQPPVIRSVRLEPSTLLAGEPVRAVVTALDPDGDQIELGYVWELNGRKVRSRGAQATFNSLSAGDTVSVRVVASDGRGQSEPMSKSSSVGNTPPRILDLAIHTRTDDDGSSVWLVEPVAEDPDGDMISYDIVWRRGNEILGRDETLSRKGWRRGDEIVVSVVARDSEDESAVLESAPIVIGNAAPDIVSKPPGLDPSGTFKYQIEASDPDGDRGLRYSLGEAPANMEIDPFAGTVTWRASIDDEGEHKVEVIVDDRKGSTAKQVFYLTVQSKSGSSPAAMR